MKSIKDVAQGIKKFWTEIGHIEWTPTEKILLGTLGVNVVLSAVARLTIKRTMKAAFMNGVVWTVANISEMAKEWKK